MDINGKKVEYCVACDENGNKLGYVFTSSSKGYGGEVSVMTAIDSEGTVLKSVVLKMDDETPGLGQNAGKEDFLEHFSIIANGFTKEEIIEIVESIEMN